MRLPILVLLACAFAAPSSHAQSPSVRIELRGERPYGFNYGQIVSQAGFGPGVELYGTNMAGDRRLLFVSQTATGLKLDFAVYNDGTLLELELIAKDAQGRPLAAEHQLSLKNYSAGERKLAEYLQFSYGAYPGLKAIGPTGLERGDAEYIARQINASYFSARRSYAPALLLAGWSLAAAFAAAFAAKKSMPSGAARRGPTIGDASSAAYGPATVQPGPALLRIARTTAAIRLGVGLALSLTLSVILIAGFGPRTQLFVMEGALAGGRVEKIDPLRHKGYDQMLWRAPDGLLGNKADLPSAEDGAPPTADYLVIRSPRGAALPLTAFDDYPYLLFSERPLVVRDSEGLLRLGGASFLAAWGIRR